MGRQSNFELLLLVWITRSEWLKSTLILKILNTGSETHIYVKTECLLAKWIKASFGVWKERIEFDSLKFGRGAWGARHKISKRIGLSDQKVWADTIEIKSKKVLNNL